MSDEQTQKKEKVDLGAAFIATNKKSPQSYDMSGTIVVEAAGAAEAEAAAEAAAAQAAAAPAEESEGE